MNIALDYDDTFTKDPRLWKMFISQAWALGHTVYLVTARNLSQMEEVYTNLQGWIPVENIHYTSYKAKHLYMAEQNIWIDVWIDDNPWSITEGMKPYE